MSTTTIQTLAASQLFVRWTFRPQRPTTLQTTGVFHVNPARLLPGTPPIPAAWINPTTGRPIL